MVRQYFDIPYYKWKVWVYYHVDTYYKDEILALLRGIGCKPQFVEDAATNMEQNRLNTGLCYSNYSSGQTVLVISKTSSPEEFLNSLFHESHHLISHIALARNLDPYGEEVAYLAGDIGLLLYPLAYKFLCTCHKKK